MRKTAIALALLLVLPGLVLAQDADRKTVSAKWAGGKVTITHGVPSWNDAFADQMSSGFVWRLGKAESSNWPAKAWSVECCGKRRVCGSFFHRPLEIHPPFSTRRSARFPS